MPNLELTRPELTWDNAKLHLRMPKYLEEVETLLAKLKSPGHEAEHYKAKILLVEQLMRDIETYIKDNTNVEKFDLPPNEMVLEDLITRALSLGIRVEGK